jgi:hypothetical protein
LKNAKYHNISINLRKHLRVEINKTRYNSTTIFATNHTDTPQKSSIIQTRKSLENPELLSNLKDK